MVEVTKAAVQNTAPMYLRDVLRQNVSALDEQAFKGKLRDSSTDLPLCIITVAGNAGRRLTYSGTKFLGPQLTFDVELTTNTQVERDTIADTIVAVFQSPSSADSDGLTLRQQGMEYKGHDITVDEDTITGGGKSKKYFVAFMSFEFKLANK